MLYKYYLAKGTMTIEKETLDFLNISNRHFPDQSAKWLFQEVENLRGLIKIIAPELVELLDFTGLTQLNSSFVSDTLRAQESDMVFSVPFRTGSTSQDELLIYILLEHQSTVARERAYARYGGKKYGTVYH